MEKESTKVLGKHKTDMLFAESDGSMQEKRNPILVIYKKIYSTMNANLFLWWVTDRVMATSVEKEITKVFGKNKIYTFRTLSPIGQCKNNTTPFYSRSNKTYL